MVKLILFTFITVFLLKDVTADCDSNKISACYKTMFKTIEDKNDTTVAMFYSRYQAVFDTAFGMWEGYSKICGAHNDLKSCLQNAGVEDCITVDDLANVDFVKQDNNLNPAKTAQSYVVDYLRYNYLCSQMNNTDRDAYTCFKYNLADKQQFVLNCTNIPTGDTIPDCFLNDIFLECIDNYANSVCGDQSRCMAKKWHALDQCQYFGGKNQHTCGICNNLKGSVDPLTNICTDSNQNNSGILPTMSLSLLFFVTLVFQIIVKN